MAKLYIRNCFKYSCLPFFQKQVESNGPSAMDLTVDFDEHEVLVENLAYLMKAVEVSFCVCSLYCWSEVNAVIAIHWGMTASQYTGTKQPVHGTTGLKSGTWYTWKMKAMTCACVKTSTPVHCHEFWPVGCQPPPPLFIAKNWFCKKWRHFLSFVFCWEFSKGILGIISLVTEAEDKYVELVEFRN